MKKSLLCLLLAALMLLSSACAFVPQDDEPEYVSTEIDIKEMVKLNTGKENGYLCSLTGDPDEDAIIWEWVEKLYFEWRERYDAILAEGDHEITPVASKSTADFTDSVYMEFTDKKGNEPTRTVKTLSGYKSVTIKEDEYGGWINEGMKQEAKGYYYTAKIDGRWYFIDPNGYPTIIRGMSGMTHAYANSQYQKDVMVTKYGTIEKWAIAATRQLDPLYINARTVIESSDPYLRDVQYKVPYQDKVQLVADYETLIGGRDWSKKSGSTILLYGMHVFDRRFPVYADEYMQEQIEKDGYYNDPYFIGYAIDNELPVNEDMLSQFMYLDKSLPINHYSYAAAWTFAVHELGKENPSPLEITRPAIQDLFRAFVYDRYYCVAVNAIRKYDDRHLILGNRALNGQLTSEAMNRVAGYWCDVVSYNWYEEWTPTAELLDNVSKWTGKPIIITEFFAQAKECEMNLKNKVDNIAPTVKTQAERGKFYQNYCLRLLECPNVAGWYWFMYSEATPGDGNSSYMNDNTRNMGLYSNNLNLYTDFAEYVAELNKNVYTIIEHLDQ